MDKSSRYECPIPDYVIDLMGKVALCRAIVAVGLESGYTADEVQKAAEELITLEAQLSSAKMEARHKANPSCG